MKFVWAGCCEQVGLRSPGRDGGTLVASVACPPGGLLAALLRLAAGRHQLPGQDEGPQARALRLLLAAHAVGL